MGLFFMHNVCKETTMFFFHTVVWNIAMFWTQSDYIWNRNLTLKQVLGALRRFSAILNFEFSFILKVYQGVISWTINLGAMEKEQKRVNYGLWLLWNLIFKLVSSHLSLFHWSFASISVFLSLTDDCLNKQK